MKKKYLIIEIIFYFVISAIEIMKIYSANNKGVNTGLLVISATLLLSMFLMVISIKHIQKNELIMYLISLILKVIIIAIICFYFLIIAVFVSFLVDIILNIYIIKTCRDDTDNYPKNIRIILVNLSVLYFYLIYAITEIMNTKIEIYLLSALVLYLICFSIYIIKRYPIITTTWILTISLLILFCVFIYLQQSILCYAVVGGLFVAFQKIIQKINSNNTLK